MRHTYAGYYAVSLDLKQTEGRADGAAVIRNIYNGGRFEMQTIDRLQRLHQRHERFPLLESPALDTGHLVFICI
jgi:hypothetical protein